MSGTTEGAYKAWVTKRSGGGFPTGATSSEVRQQHKPLSPEREAVLERASYGSGESLSRPQMMLGIGDTMIHQEEFSNYLESAGGREWKGAPLPEGIRMGTPKECFKNASQLVLGNPDLSYCEGIGYSSEVSLANIGFLHGWTVTQDGTVVDNTWADSKDCKYFGVKYDRESYIAHMLKTEMYGIFGGKLSVARKVLERGGL